MYLIVEKVSNGFIVDTGSLGCKAIVKDLKEVMKIVKQALTEPKKKGVRYDKSGNRL